MLMKKFKREKDSVKRDKERLAEQMYYKDNNNVKMEEVKRRKQDQDQKFLKSKQQEFRALMKKQEKVAQNRLDISNQLRAQMSSVQRAGTSVGMRDSTGQLGLQRHGTTDIYGLTEVRTRGQSVTGGRANYNASSINSRRDDEEQDYIDTRMKAYEEKFKRAADLKNQRKKESIFSKMQSQTSIDATAE